MDDELVWKRRLLLLANEDDSKKDDLKGPGCAPSNQHHFCLVGKQTSVVKTYIFIHFLEDLFTIVLYSQTKLFKRKRIIHRQLPKITKTVPLFSRVHDV